MKKIIFTVMMLFAFSAVPHVAVAGNKSLKCLHYTDHDELKKLAGEYILSELIEDVKKNKKFYESINNLSAVDEIDITEKGEVNFLDNYHEGWSWDALPDEQKSKECLKSIDKNTIIFHSNTSSQSDGEKDLSYKYSRIPSIGTGRFFFNLLLQGCYKDPENKKWCFEDGENNRINCVIKGDSPVLNIDGRVVIDGKKYAAEFVLDGSELPNADAIIRVDGEKMFWAFYKTKNGLSMCKTEYISKENYKSEPCRSLIKN